MYENAGVTMYRKCNKDIIVYLNGSCFVFFVDFVNIPDTCSHITEKLF